MGVQDLEKSETTSHQVFMSEGFLAKRVLFLSGVDFKEKSIQVIRKTPEAYVNDGWEVHYVVGRDDSVNGDYFYESVINPNGVHVHRFLIPLARLHGMFNSVIWKAFWFRVRNIVLVWTLCSKAIHLIKQRDFDVIYGYEIPGVLAIRLLRFRRIKSIAKIVTRFQGVLYVKEWLRRNEGFRYISNADAVMALKTKADLCIMTNDGSQGLSVLKQLKSPLKNILFCSNGVDPVNLDPTTLEQIRAQYYGSPCNYFLSVSRLDGHKRIDRTIRVLDNLVNGQGKKNVKLIVIGGGVEHDSLLRMVASKGLNSHVEFLGPVKHDIIKYHLALAHIFFSMYTSTNVGNPLLEAIRYNKIIVTLNNGDTGDWIKHQVSGLIYDVNDDTDLSDSDYEKIANDVHTLINDKTRCDIIKAGIKDVERTKLWTWDERFKAELDRVKALLTE
jgi:glycosyltransferase involved in cell wall biosynthesis